MSVKLKCNCCTEICNDLALFLSHLKSNFAAYGNKVTCPYQNCKAIFKLKSSFLSHIS